MALHAEKRRTKVPSFLLFLVAVGILCLQHKNAPCQNLSVHTATALAFRAKHLLPVTAIFLPPAIGGRTTKLAPLRLRQTRAHRNGGTSSDTLVFSASSPVVVRLPSFLDGEPTAAGLLRVLIPISASRTAIHDGSESACAHGRKRMRVECTEDYLAPLRLPWAPIPPVLTFCELLRQPLPCANMWGSKY